VEKVVVEADPHGEVYQQIKPFTPFKIQVTQVSFAVAPAAAKRQTSFQTPGAGSTACLPNRWGGVK